MLAKRISLKEERIEVSFCFSCVKARVKNSKLVGGICVHKGVVQEPSSQVAEAAEGGERPGREVKEGELGEER